MPKTRKRRSQTLPTKAVHGEVEHTAALLDVRLLDVLAELESLLRSGRNIQRDALRIRGVPSPPTDAQRVAAAARVKKTAAAMERDYRHLADILRALRAHAADLHRSV